MTLHGYHDRKKPPRPRQRTVENLSTPATVYAANGSIATFGFPCYYQVMRPPIHARQHCKDWHDHVGVPSPNHPDHSCQPAHEYAAWWDELHYHDGRLYPDYHRGHHHPHHTLRHLLDMRSLRPIHLTKEGYDKVYVTIKDAPEGLTAEAWIDETRDWVIKVRFDIAIEEAEVEPQDFLYTVVVEGKSKDNPETKERRMRNVAVRGLLHVDPGIITTYRED